jgi:hypothetical protein
LLKTARKICLYTFLLIYWSFLLLLWRDKLKETFWWLECLIDFMTFSLFHSFSVQNLALPHPSFFSRLLTLRLSLFSDIFGVAVLMNQRIDQQQCRAMTLLYVWNANNRG